MVTMDTGHIWAEAKELTLPGQDGIRETRSLHSFKGNRLRFHCGESFACRNLLEFSAVAFGERESRDFVHRLLLLNSECLLRNTSF